MPIPSVLVDINDFATGSLDWSSAILSLANSQFRPPLVVETIHGNAFPSDTDLY